MYKGAIVAIVCLALGGFIGHKATIWELDRNASMFFKGKEIGKSEPSNRK